MQEAANDPGELSPDEAAYAAACADLAAGRFDAARDVFLALRARLPVPNPNVELRLAATHYRLGNLSAADAVLDGVLSLDPASCHSHLLRARLRADQGDAAGAAASLGEAERCAPEEAASWLEIGQLHAEYWRWDEADRALDRAGALDPGHPSIASLAAIVKGERGDDPGARAVLETALRRSPGDLSIALGYNLYLPQVYESVEDLDRWRARYARGLGEMSADLGRWRANPRQALELNRTNFLLAYQGGDDLGLQRGYSQLLRSLAGAARPDWLEGPARRAVGSRRLRVGFAATTFRDCTAGRYFEHWITGLDPARFERRVYHAAPIVDDFTRRIAAGCDHFETLRAEVESTIDHLRAEALDVLVLPEVGMWPLSYLLSAVRVAPVQCAGWGHPVTTGGDAIDYYFTCADMEPAQAATHYSEKLVPLPGLGVRYAMPATGEAFARAQLRLPEDRPLYVCPQSLFKIHPAMDALLARLLARDPAAILVFFQAPARGLTERFAVRMQRALQAQGVEPAGQLKFLPRMNGEAFRRVLAMADVVLDTLHWSGGNTSLDAIAAGTPLVTLPGRFMRGRQSAAMLRIMGLGELVADSEETYLQRAIEIAHDRARNQALRRAIAQRRGALFDRHEPIEAFQEALIRLASA